jgi:ribonuclease HII
MTKRIDPALIPHQPDLSFESSLWAAGFTAVAGIDEAGRGCLAGPVAAGVVLLPHKQDLPTALSAVRDSKQISAAQRQNAREQILETALCWEVGFASALEIDSLGIVPATRLAAMRAISKLSVNPDYLLLDYLALPEFPHPQTSLIKGDARSLSIACASVLAKTERDAWMVQKADSFPVYDWKSNKGYGTQKHRSAIEEHGPSPEHRRSFAPLKEQLLQRRLFDENTFK